MAQTRMLMKAEEKDSGRPGFVLDLRVTNVVSFAWELSVG